MNHAHLRILALAAVGVFAVQLRADVKEVNFEAAQLYIAGAPYDDNLVAHVDWVDLTQAEIISEVLAITGTGALPSPVAGVDGFPTDFSIGAQVARFENHDHTSSDPSDDDGIAIATAAASGDASEDTGTNNLYQVSFWFRTVDTGLPTGTALEGHWNLDVRLEIVDEDGFPIGAFGVYSSFQVEETGTLLPGLFWFPFDDPIFNEVVDAYDDPLNTASDTTLRLIEWGKWYQVRIVINFVPGPSNDTVSIYLKPHGGTEALINDYWDGDPLPAGGLTTLEDELAARVPPPPTLPTVVDRVKVRGIMPSNNDAGPPFTGIHGLYIDELTYGFVDCNCDNIWDEICNATTGLSESVFDCDALIEEALGIADAFIVSNGCNAAELAACLAAIESDLLAACQ